MRVPPLHRERVVLAGRVIDKRSGDPLAGALVELAQTSGSPIQPPRTGGAMTGVEGRFAFAGISPGTYAVSVSFPGGLNRYACAEQDVDMSCAAKATFVEIELTPTAVTGTVTAPLGKDGASVPVALARVWAKGSGECTYTDAGGRYVLSAVEASPPTGEGATTRRLIFRAGGLDAHEEAVKLREPGASARCDVVLSLSAPR